MVLEMSQMDCVATQSNTHIMHTVYLLACYPSDTTYVGYSEDVARRCQQHNNGNVKHTKGRQWTLLATVTGFPTRRAAERFEKRVKRVSVQRAPQETRVACRVRKLQHALGRAPKELILTIHEK